MNEERRRAGNQLEANEEWNQRQGGPGLGGSALANSNLSDSTVIVNGADQVHQQMMQDN